VNTRYFLVVSTALLSLLSFAHGANADGGVYQRTKDGKAMVWNNYPLPGDAATWSGDRDLDGYATGYGTLIWSRKEQKIVTGSSIPISKHIAVTSYSGMMIQGKLDGPVVNVDTNGKTFHGTFVDGRKTKDWAVGPAPSPSSTDTVASQPRNESVEQDVDVEPPAEGPSPSPANQARNERVHRDPVVEVPAEGPPQGTSRTASTANKPGNERVERLDEHISTPPIAITQTSPRAADDSLRSLTGPPALLRNNPGAEPSPQASVPSTTSLSSSAPVVSKPRLTTAQVIELADIEARGQGYALGGYQHPQAHYIPADGTWSVFYDQKSVDSNAMGEVADPFTVSVEDKTKKTSIVPQK
jgi:hypothetical protein